MREYHIDDKRNISFRWQRKIDVGNGKTNLSDNTETRKEYYYLNYYINIQRKHELAVSKV